MYNYATDFEELVVKNTKKINILRMKNHFCYFFRENSNCKGKFCDFLISFSDVVLCDQLLLAHEGNTKCSKNSFKNILLMLFLRVC